MTPTASHSTREGGGVGHWAGVDDEAGWPRRVVPEGVRSHDTVGLADHVAARVEVDVVLGERRRADLHPQPMPRQDALAGVPHGDLDLIDLVRYDVQRLAMPGPEAQPDHPVTQPLGEVV